jgi:hypothetical protein
MSIRLSVRRWCSGTTNHYLRATIQADGSFSIFNPGKGMSRTYRSR